MCGGTLEVKNDESIGICEYCGTKQTLPKLDDDRRANLYDRANHFRRNNEFDKAMGIYEQILNEDSTDAEAYWSVVLCRYGIEYVEDPANHKRVPTVNRTQFTSVFADDDYKSAICYADVLQKEIYEQEAKTIDDIQRRILEISQEEEPFDVFICYKETDANGRRTLDSVLANDLYYQLEKEGFKVFFSRITLEDKLGTAYEPYIFAALNSAKAMVVLGTKPEYFNAVWVKNEWSRYLALIKKGEKKTLIPAYRDMDPYDLPEEFSHLQAQDMGKLGFMQDLVRGVNKIIRKEYSYTNSNSKDTKNQEAVSSFVKRAFLFLEDRDWKNANDYCEKILDLDPENAYGYLGKMMAELKTEKISELGKLSVPLQENQNYSKVCRFANVQLKNEIEGYNLEIISRNRTVSLNNEYDKAFKMMQKAKTEANYIKAAEMFEKIKDYKDSAIKKANCEKLAENCKNKANKNKNKAKKLMAVIVPSVAACIAIVFVVSNIVVPSIHYKDALDMLESNNFREAYVMFKQLEDYKDAQYQKEATKIKEAVNLAENKKTEKAVEILKNMQMEEKLANMVYDQSLILAGKGFYDEAIAFIEAVPEISEQSKKLNEIIIEKGKNLVENGLYKEGYHSLLQIKDDEVGKEVFLECGYLYGSELLENGKIGEAIIVFEEILDKKNNYKDVSEKILEVSESALEYFSERGDYKRAVEYYEESKSFNAENGLYINAKYNYGIGLIKEGEYEEAIKILESVKDYKDSKEQIKSAKYRFVKANFDNKNEKTYEYMKDLKKAKYIDSVELYKELYSWKLEVIAINSSDEADLLTMEESIDGCKPIWFWFEINGGEPGAILKIKEYATYSSVADFDSWYTHEKEYFAGEKHASGWPNGLFKGPEYIVEGTLKVEYFDQAGNKIGEGSVKITK